MRLIDADALKESVHAHDYMLKDCLNSTDKGMFTVGIMQAIDEQPTIDAVPVIRCSACKHWATYVNQTAIPNLRKCKLWRTIGTFPIDYCSRAERRGEE